MPRASNPGRQDQPENAFWRHRARNIRAFLNMRVFRRQQSAPSKLTFSIADRANGRRSRLQTCCERALDAHTVEDAIFWHSEVINELSVEIFSISAMPWSQAKKERILAELADLQNRHGAILHRLTGIVARSEQLVWQPSSICKK